MSSTPPPLQADADKVAGRDAALDLLARARAALVSHAFQLACYIWSQRGEVSSTDVWQALYAEATMNAQLHHWLSVADERWMGAVFRGGKGWVRLRWESSGSHKRPVAVWTRS